MKKKCWIGKIRIYWKKKYIGSLGSITICKALLRALSSFWEDGWNQAEREIDERVSVLWLVSSFDFLCLFIYYYYISLWSISRLDLYCSLPSLSSPHQPHHWRQFELNHVTVNTNIHKHINSAKISPTHHHNQQQQINKSLTKPTVSSALDGGPRTLSRDESLAAPQSYSSSISTIQFSAVANKSSLFTNTNGLNNDISPSSPSIGSSGSSSSQTPTDGSAAEPRWMNMTLKTTTTMIVAKPQPNHGKPNLAPKPPGMQNTPPPPPPVQPNGLGLPSAKVSRHHSMKSPRYCTFLFCW